VYFKIRHLTRFQYSASVTESLVEVRMHPRTEGCQRCLDYQLAVTPKAPMSQYRDYLGNNVHHFSLPGAHRQLQLLVESIVEMTTWPDWPASLTPDAWAELDRLIESGDYWEMLLPSHFAKTTPLLEDLMREFGAIRRDDPFSLVREINARLFETFEYAPGATEVDSPIDKALSKRHGVCQDFSHIMIALLRQLRIPARYVSGYLHHGADDNDRSSEGATHAWVEAFLPTLGWVGFDPTNNLVARERHIRTALGRDYNDVPPTRGVFKGEAETRLSVAVNVTPCEELPAELAELVMGEEQVIEQAVLAAELEQQEQQQQQQQ
jgi:transglutaminase-like putative cysteine protease